jgi:hypothetical protein
MSYREPGPDADAAELDAWDDHIHAQFEQDEPYRGQLAGTASPWEVGRALGMSDTEMQQKATERGMEVGS